MSNYQQPTKHPETGRIEVADWLDDFFGRHRYGVRFPDGKVFRASEVERHGPTDAVLSDLCKALGDGWSNVSDIDEELRGMR